MFSALPAELGHAIHAARDRLGAFAEVRYAETIGSTNDAALALAFAGAADGTSVIADQQTAGRGRRGHAWSSPAGAGLYLSTLIRGEGLAASPGLVTLGAGAAAADAVQAATGLPLSVQWPNDLVIGRAWRKVGGILCEAQGRDVIVVGIGINVTAAAHPPDVAARATSIETELGRPVDRAALTVECLARLGALAGTLRSDQRKEVLDRWRARAVTDWQGAPVRWQDGGRDVYGLAVDVDDDGALVVECLGRRQRVIAGEVIWEPRP